MLVFGTQVRGFKPGRSRWIFQGEKILNTPSFGGEVKPSVPRRFTACKRYVYFLFCIFVFYFVYSVLLYCFVYCSNLCPGRGASQMEKSRLNWATQFLTVAYDGACSPNITLRMA